MALAQSLKVLLRSTAQYSIRVTGARHLTAQRSMGKRKQDVEIDSDDEEQEVKPKKAKTPRAKKVTEPFVDEQGFNVEPPSLIWKDFGTEPGAKVAAFDLDGTLVNVKSGRQFPSHAGDWKWWNKKTPKTLKEFADDGYKIVLFTNQGSIKGALAGAAAKKVKERINLIAAKLKDEEDVAIQVFIAPAMTEGDPMRKPAAGMWHYMAQNCNEGIKPELSECFFVGDADGSHGTHGDGDKKFAEAVGMEFKLPQDVFGPMEGKAVIGSDDAKAGLEQAHAGTHPNAELVLQFEELTKQTFEAAKRGESDTFKAAAYNKATRSLATFRDKISESNLKEVGKLPGVGKGTLDRIKMYLKSGNILGEEEAAKANEAEKEQTQKYSKAAEAAMKFL